MVFKQVTLALLPRLTFKQDHYIMRTRIHKKQNVQTRLKENLIIMVVIVMISLWAVLFAS